MHDAAPLGTALTPDPRITTRAMGTKGAAHPRGAIVSSWGTTAQQDAAQDAAQQDAAQQDAAQQDAAQQDAAQQDAAQQDAAEKRGRAHLLSPSVTVWLL